MDLAAVRASLRRVRFVHVEDFAGVSLADRLHRLLEAKVSPREHRSNRLTPEPSARPRHHLRHFERGKENPIEARREEVGGFLVEVRDQVSNLPPHPLGSLFHALPPSGWRMGHPRHQIVQVPAQRRDPLEVAFPHLAVHQRTKVSDEGPHSRINCDGSKPLGLGLHDRAVSRNDEKPSSAFALDAGAFPLDLHALASVELNLRRASKDKSVLQADLVETETLHDVAPFAEIDLLEVASLLELRLRVLDRLAGIANGMLSNPLRRREGPSLLLRVDARLNELSSFREACFRPFASKMCNRLVEPEPCDPGVPFHQREALVALRIDANLPGSPDRTS